ncbi:MAG: Methyltransferase type 11 [Frankiales bacterium]|nr:Methyltransferase type 11 [Frankiales bacterium]
MDQPPDTNAAIWKSAEVIQNWAAEADDRERKRGEPRRLMAELLPFDQSEKFTFLDLGAGTGAASRGILAQYPNSTAILADFSPQMMGAGEREMQPFAGRFRYVEFDMAVGGWPDDIPTSVGAIITSLSVHHLTDTRKQSLFGEIYGRLAAGGWYLNYDPVTAPDRIVEATWQRVNEREDPTAAHQRQHRSHSEQERWDNHVRYMIPLAQQLDYLRAAGFEGIDVYWKRLENVIYGGRRPN